VKSVLGVDLAYRDVPYFWSDQYETKLQILGLFGNYDDMIVRCDDESQFISFYMKGNKIAAVAGFNRSQDIAVARRLMQKNVEVDRQRLVSVKSLNEILRIASVAL
jgi:3-phenylpropionate/trans-cinnamate dioxygenase ferredoxin reductase subunit